jgi:hypothetical protein
MVAIMNPDVGAVLDAYLDKGHDASPFAFCMKIAASRFWPTIADELRRLAVAIPDPLRAR